MELISQFDLTMVFRGTRVIRQLSSSGTQDDFRHHSIFDNFKTALGWLAEGKVLVQGLGLKCNPANAQKTYQALLHPKCECPTIIFGWT